MAIKNTSLGGTDWGDEETPSAQDLNDTLDAMFSKVQTLSAFWLNSDLYDVYDDFESYSTGAFTDNAKWDVTEYTEASSTAFVTIETGKHVLLDANSTAAGGGAVSEGYAQIEALQMTANAHKHCTGTALINRGVSLVQLECQIIFGGNTYNIDTADGVTLDYELFIVAKGSNVYDVYINGNKVGSDVSTADPDITFKAIADAGNQNNCNCEMTVDDIRESKSTIS